jgi:NTE family protein
MPAGIKGDFVIESLPIRYAAVATELKTGHEIWFKTGSMFDAIRASISVPGIFEPFHLNGRWYVDGGIVNPVPVSACRALGADIVIAVNLNKIPVGQPSNHFQRKVSIQSTPDAMVADETHNLPYRLAQDLKDRVSEALSQIWRGGRNKPGLFYVLNNSAYFMQESITRR